MIHHPLTSLVLSLSLAAAVLVSTNQPTEPLSIERATVSTPLTLAEPTVIIATTPTVTGPEHKLGLERVSFTAKQTPPPPPLLVSLASENTVSAPSAYALDTPLARRGSTSTLEPVTPPPISDAPVASTVSSSKGSAVVSEASKYLGVPYLWGGTSPSKGLDCSGLVQLVFGNLGVELPRVARQQATKGVEVGSLDKAKPGDLLGMRNGTHIAIYLGDNKILHAPRPGETVSIRSLTQHDDIDTIRRIT